MQCLPEFPYYSYYWLFLITYLLPLTNFSEDVFLQSFQLDSFESSDC